MHQLFFSRFSLRVKVWLLWPLTDQKSVSWKNADALGSAVVVCLWCVCALSMVILFACICFLIMILGGEFAGRLYLYMHLNTRCEESVGGFPVCSCKVHLWRCNLVILPSTSLFSLSVFLTIPFEFLLLVLLSLLGISSVPLPWVFLSSLCCCFNIFSGRLACSFHYQQLTKQWSSLHLNSMLFLQVKPFSDLLTLTHKPAVTPTGLPYASLDVLSVQVCMLRSSSRGLHVLCEKEKI